MLMLHKGMLLQQRNLHLKILVKLEDVIGQTFQ